LRNGKRSGDAGKNDAGKMMGRRHLWQPSAHPHYHAKRRIQFVREFWRNADRGFDCQNSVRLR